MVKLSIKTIGHMPVGFEKQKLLDYKSGVFSIVGEVSSFDLREDSLGENWEYTDAQLTELISGNDNQELTVIIVNVPLELNWYSRRLNHNCIAVTFYQIRDILDEAHIPLENLILRILSAYSLVFMRNGHRLPIEGEGVSFTHDETRGCIFDMNANKRDVVVSCHKPIICDECTERLKRENNVSNEVISRVKRDLKKIKQPLAFRIVSFVQRHPLWALGISTVYALILGVSGSIIGSLLLR